MTKKGVVHHRGRRQSFLTACGLDTMYMVFNPLSGDSTVYRGKSLEKGIWPNVTCKRCLATRRKKK